MHQSDFDPKLFKPGAEDFGDDDPSIAYNRVWFNIARSHRRILPAIAASLKEHGIKDPLWYDIILEIERAGKSGHLMSDLEVKLNIPQYALSRHISRLEKAGLVRRAFVADGRRKQLLFLTDKSAGLSEHVWPAYMDAIQKETREKLEPEEAYLLTRLLIKLQL